MTKAKLELMKEYEYDLSICNRRLSGLQKDKAYIEEEYKKYTRLVEEEMEKKSMLEQKISKLKKGGLKTYM